MAQIIPLTPAPNQTIVANLVVNGQATTLTLSFSFNQVIATPLGLYWDTLTTAAVAALAQNGDPTSATGFWVMNVADENNNPIVSSIPLLTGIWPGANVLAPYDYLGIGSAYVVNQTGAATDWPDDTNLGSGFVIVWDDNPSYSGVAIAQ